MVSLLDFMGLRRRTGRFAIAIAMLATFGSTLHAQDEEPTGSGPPPIPNVEEPVSPEEGFIDGSGVLTWAEPNRIELLRNDYPEIKKEFVEPNGPVLMRMAAGQAAPDPRAISKYVNYYIGILTDHSNIESLLNPGGDSRGAHKMQAASDALLAPLRVKLNARNSGFRQTYASALLAVAPDVLQGQLHTRLFFMIALSQSRSPEVVPFLSDLLTDPDQPAVVKILAAIGVRNVATAPNVNMNVRSQSIPAAQALSQFLSESESIIWPARQRALEALGSLRQATANPIAGKVEFADEPFRLLNNPREHSRVRGTAGWALGMLNVPASIRGFNYDLIAFEIGRAAAAIGDRILADSSSELTNGVGIQKVTYDLEPLISLLAAFDGDPTLARSGLTHSQHPSAVAASTKMREIETRVRALATTSYRLSIAAGSLIPQARSTVRASLQDLNTYLAANPPENPELYPGGPSTVASPAEAAAPNPPEGADLDAGR